MIFSLLFLFSFCFFSPIKLLLFIKKHLQPIYFHLYTLLKRCFIYPIPSFLITYKKEVSTYKNKLIEKKKKRANTTRYLLFSIVRYTLYILITHSTQSTHYLFKITLRSFCFVSQASVPRANSLFYIIKWVVCSLKQ